MTVTDLTLAEGKTKIVRPDPSHPQHVLIHSKDDITAGDGARADVLPGKGELATAITCNVFHLLNLAHVTTHYLERVDDVTFRARRCTMIPLEVVLRRQATGSYLRRFPETAEGTRFVPLLQEFFLKDDARHDPQIAENDIVSQGYLSAAELPAVKAEAVRVFEVLERAWALQDVVLVDLKVEFGRLADGSVVLADVVDNDSWRIWPGGDKAAMKDKQVYRNLTETTDAALAAILDNYRWVADKTESFLHTGRGQAVVLIQASAEEKTGRAILKVLETFGVEGHLRVASAEKDPVRLLEMARDYDASGRPLVFIAVAGRSLGLGAALDGMTANPVLHCSPPTDRFGGLDILSSLCVPAGLAVSNVLEADTAALAAVKILAVHDAALWGRLRAHYDRLRELLRASDERLHTHTPAAAAAVPKPTKRRKGAS